MDVLSQLPSLFQQMEGEQGSKLLENLMRFTALINKMDENAVVAFYQALDLLEESHDKGTIFSRPKSYKMLQKVKKMAIARMVQLFKDIPYGEMDQRKSSLINLKKAIPDIYDYINK